MQIDVQELPERRRVVVRLSDGGIRLATFGVTEQEAMELISRLEVAIWHMGSARRPDDEGAA